MKTTKEFIVLRDEFREPEFLGIMKRYNFSWNLESIEAIKSDLRDILINGFQVKAKFPSLMYRLERIDILNHLDIEARVEVHTRSMNEQRQIALNIWGDEGMISLILMPIENVKRI